MATRYVGTTDNGYLSSIAEAVEKTDFCGGCGKNSHGTKRAALLCLARWMDQEAKQYRTQAKSFRVEAQTLVAHAKIMKEQNDV